MRLFIAIPLDSMKNILLDDIASLKRVPGFRGTYPLSFHLTLKFLGEVEKEKVIMDMLSTLRFRRFTLGLGDVGTFPPRGDPRVIWRAVVPHDQVVALQGEVDGCLKGLFTKEGRFHPHITLARVKAPGDISTWKPAPCQEIVNVDSFELIDSVLSSSGPCYHVLRSYPLG